MKAAIDKRKISDNFLIFFLIFPYFKPMCFSYVFQYVDTIYSMLRIVSMMLTFFLYFYNVKNKQQKTLAILTILYMFSFVFSSVFNNQNISVVNAISILSTAFFVMTLQYVLTIDERGALNIIARYMEILLAINYICYLIYPHGIAQSSGYGNHIHFLANRNSLIPIYIFAAVILILSKLSDNKELLFRDKSEITIVLLSVFPFRSGTGIICSFILIVLIWLENDKIFRNLSYKRVVTLYSIIFTVIVLFRFTEVFSGIFEMVGKDYTLTGRIYLWKSATEIIKDSSFSNFVFGYGFITNGYILYDNGMYYTSHNMILEMFLRGGLIAAVCFILIITHTCVSKKKNLQLKYLYIVLFTYLLATMTETALTVIYLYGILTLINFYTSKEV